MTPLSLLAGRTVTVCHQDCLYHNGILIEIFEQLKLSKIAFMIANNADTGHLLTFCCVSFGSSLVPDIRVLTMGQVSDSMTALT